MPDAFADMAQAIGADTNLSKTCTYTPPNASALPPFPVRLYDHDRDLVDGQSRATKRAPIVEVAAADLPSPEKGATLSIDGVGSFRLKEAFHPHDDTDRRWWWLDVVAL